jgi:hypothetical protein
MDSRVTSGDIITPMLAPKVKGSKVKENPTRSVILNVIQRP